MATGALHAAATDFVEARDTARRVTAELETVRCELAATKIGRTGGLRDDEAMALNGAIAAATRAMRPAASRLVTTADRVATTGAVLDAYQAELVAAAREELAAPEFAATLPPATPAGSTPLWKTRLRWSTGGIGVWIIFSMLFSLAWLGANETLVVENCRATVRAADNAVSDAMQRLRVESATTDSLHERLDR